MKSADTLVALALQFAGLSLVAFGGANAVIPAIHHQAVDVRHWMTNQDFAALFAAFFAIALSGFGGVLPFARRTLVERRGWLTAADHDRHVDHVGAGQALA